MGNTQVNFLNTTTLNFVVVFFSPKKPAFLVTDYLFQVQVSAL